MTGNYVTPLLFALAIGAAAPAGAQQAPAADGSEVQGLYESALQSIAEGRKNDASATLMRVIEKEPLHAGAYLEVALIQCSLGRSDEAERLFAIIETRFSPPPGIQALIAEARETGCDKWQGLSSSSFSVGRGYDHNVNQGANNPIVVGAGTLDVLLPEFLPKADQYSVVTADYMRELAPNGAIGFAQFQSRRNDKLSDYDSVTLYLGAEMPYRFGDWTVRATGLLGMVGLGGEFYQRQLQAQARVTPPLPLPASMQFNVLASATHADYLTLTNFNADTFELRGQFSYRKNDWYTSASIGAQTDRARDLRPGGDRSGYALNLLARGKVAEAMVGEVGLSRQRWNGKEMYLPGLIDIVRDQRTDVLRAALTYQLTKSQALQLEARAIRNKETISFFEYDSHQVQLSWQVQMP
jgi:hypothetical protein